MFSAAEAARFLDEAHRARARYQNLPEAIAPRNFDEAYAAQEALCALWGPRLGPVAGRKIATTTKVMQQLMGIDHPCGGTIFASRVHTLAGHDRQGRLRQRAHRVRAGGAARPRPAEGPAPYTRESVRAAVAEIMAAFELIEDRNADYKTCKALSLIADNAWNGGIVIGPGKAAAGGSRSQRHRRPHSSATARKRRPARPTIRSARWRGSPTWPPSAAGR